MNPFIPHKLGFTLVPILEEGKGLSSTFEGASQTAAPSEGLAFAHEEAFWLNLGVSDSNRRGLGIPRKGAAQPLIDLAYSTWRYQLPYPISSAHKLAYSQHEPSARLPLTLRFAQETFRFMALVGVADGLAAKPKRKKAKDWLRALRKPGVGTFLFLIDNVAKFLAENDDRKPYLEELTDLLADSEWLGACDILRQDRNRFAHDDLFIDRPDALERLASLEEPLGILLGKTGFLQSYTLAWMRCGRRLGDKFEQYCYPCRGIEEIGDPIKFRATYAFTEGLVLLDPQAERALQLSPLLRGSAGKRSVWFLDRFGPEDEWTNALYRHPERGKQEESKLLTDANDPEKFLSIDEFLESSEAWPSIVLIGSSAEDKKALLAGARPSRGMGYYLEIVGRLGTGAMGEVWEVKDTKLDRRCALKRLKSHQEEDPDVLERFLREAKALAKVDDPGVVRVLSLLDDPPAILMELVEGEDFGTWIELRGCLSPLDALQTMADTLSALEAVHKEGIIHRDLTPRNVIRAAKGPKLIDFGIAHFDEATRLTQNQPPGTPGYIAPERFQGEESPRSDIYSAGCLLYTLLAGVPPKPGTMLEGLDPTIETIVGKATANNPSERYQSASEMREAILGAIKKLEPKIPKTEDEQGTSGDQKVVDKPVVECPTVDDIWSKWASEAFKKRLEEGQLQGTAFLNELLDNAWEILSALGKAETEKGDRYVSVAVLTTLFHKIRSETTPVIVERVVTDVDRIAALVQFPGWEHTRSSERELEKALRQTLSKYQLHRDKVLFEKANKYIQQYF